MLNRFLGDRYATLTTNGNAPRGTAACAHGLLVMCTENLKRPVSLNSMRTSAARHRATFDFLRAVAKFVRITPMRQSRKG